MKKFFYWINQIFQKELYGYRKSVFWTSITWVFIVLTVGILRMVFHWFPEWFLNCTHTRCPLETAEKVLIVVSLI